VDIGHTLFACWPLSLFSTCNVSPLESSGVEAIVEAGLEARKQKLLYNGTPQTPQTESRKAEDAATISPMRLSWHTFTATGATGHTPHSEASPRAHH